MLKDLLFKLTAVLLLVASTNLAYGQGMSCDMAEAVTVGTYTLADTIPSNGNNTNPPANGGAADGSVWYAFTPTATGSIDVDACLGGVDTRVFIHTGACDALTTVAGNDDSCLLSEGGNAWASAVEGVTVIGGSTYYIEWDNNWENAAFAWNLSFEPLPAADVAAAHAQVALNIPDSQSDLIGLVGNLGSQPLTGVVLTAEVFAAADLTTPIMSVSADPVDLAVSEVMQINVGSWMPTEGDFAITYSAVANETEEESEMANNSDTGLGVFTVTDLTYTLEAEQTNALGLNAGGTIIQGNTFLFYGTDTLASVFTSYTGGVEGDTAEIVIYTTDANGAPMDLVYTQAAPIEAGEKTVTLDEGFEVNSGDNYFVGTRSVNAGSNFGMGISEGNVYSGVSWLSINGGAWGNTEGIGFPGTYVVRLNMKGELAAPMATLSVDMSNETVAAEGVFLAGSFNGWDPTATPMDDSDGDGVYTVTVDLPMSEAVQYKFVNGTSFESVPSACTVNDGAGNLNREISINMDTELAAVCFGACQGCFDAIPAFDACDVNAGTLICDNLDSYTLGSISDQAAHWAPWPGGGSADVSADFAQSPANSMIIAGGLGVDQTLLFPSNATEGVYNLGWSYYVPTGGAAYFNLQGDREDIGGTYKIECILAGGGVGELTQAGNAIAFSYPEDEWFDVAILLDFDTPTATLFIAGSGVATWDLTNDVTAAGGVAQVGAVNFYPINATYVCYVDDVYLVGPTADLTVSVNTATIDVDAAGMFLAGDFNGWSNGAMTNNGDVWTATVTTTANQTHEYKFKNGDSGWEEGIVGDCVLDNGNRFVAVGGGATEVDEVCFESCTAVCESAVIDQVLDAAIVVTPNPTSGVFNVAYNMEVASDLDIRLTNMLGQVVAVRTVDNALAGNESFDLTNMPAGTYTLVTTTGERLSTKRIVLQ